MRLRTVVLAAALVSLLAAPVSAADRLVVGKAFPTSFGMVPINVGVASGIMAKYRLDVTIVGFEGAAKLQQGITAGDVDVGLGAGTDMAFVKKGAPDKAVAATVKIDMAADAIADPAIASATYDAVMPMFSRDGRFDPKALAVTRRAMVELRLLPTEPDMAPLYTEAFLPKQSD